MEATTELPMEEEPCIPGVATTDKVCQEIDVPFKCSCGKEHKRTIRVYSDGSVSEIKHITGPVEDKPL